MLKNTFSECTRWHENVDMLMVPMKDEFTCNASFKILGCWILDLCILSIETIPFSRLLRKVEIQSHDFETIKNCTQSMFKCIESVYIQQLYCIIISNFPEYITGSSGITYVHKYASIFDKYQLC